MVPWSLARKKTIALQADAEPVVVKGNRYAIGDAIRNLVENAAAHAPPSSEVTVSTSANGTVSVADHGPGIAAEQRKHIFERFWRGSGKGGSGAGLGLAIVMEIMKAHHGSISVDDNPGGGVIFTLRFGHLMSRPKKKSPAGVAGPSE
jgi:signal transduction histidine kinase